NVAVHNSKDSWVNSRRCQIGTYDTDFVSAAKRQHPELTALSGYNPIPEETSTQVSLTLGFDGPLTFGPLTFTIQRGKT
ncbi:MAG: hypothetical protein ABSE84_04935, partial [Isosphaeraceae bacterium]